MKRIKKKSEKYRPIWLRLRKKIVAIHFFFQTLIPTRGHIKFQNIQRHTSTDKTHPFSLYAKRAMSCFQYTSFFRVRDKKRRKRTMTSAHFFYLFRIRAESLARWRLTLHGIGQKGKLWFFDDEISWKNRTAIY